MIRPPPRSTPPAPRAPARSSARACADAAGSRGRGAASGGRSSGQSLPEFREALGGNRHRRFQLLREQRDAQLLEEPAEPLEAFAERSEAAFRYHQLPFRTLEVR